MKKRIMYYVLFILIAIAAATVLVLNQKKFGKAPSGLRLERIKKSPNYSNSTFQNQSVTPVMTEGVGFVALSKEFFFAKKQRVTPEDSIPSKKADLKNLDINENVLIWFGHSSYFIQIDGKRILVDPVLSGHASPFSFSIKAFTGSDVYLPEEIPVIDYLFITHDHWDHLDYETIMSIKPNIKKIVTGLGTGEHFEYWGFNKDSIIEMDWYDTVALEDSFRVYSVPARHFSGRGFKRNQSLWSAFLLETKAKKIFVGGDGGYDKHFAEVGEKFGEIDLAIIENGQYNKNWKYIHLLPEEQVKVIKDLKAKKVLSVHSSKFALGNHAWDEPLKKISENSKKYNLPLITPMIGEKVDLDSETQKFTEWWSVIN